MKFVPEKLTRAVAMQVFKTQKHSPTILFAGGIVGVVGTVVLASKATLKLESVLEETEAKMVKVNTLYSPDYSDNDRAHDKAVLYIETVVKITKLYGPALLLGTASIAMLAGSNRILTRRNASLTAAYVALEKGFDQYRARVIEELGEEKDREFRYGTQTVEIEDEKTGKKVKKKVLGDGSYSIYARCFDETNVNWQGFPEADRVFLDTHQQYANNRLRAKGHLLLNDVYRALGFPDTPEGCVVGWIWDGDGDNYVDFGFGNWPSAHDYIHAKEHGVMLDFNVDGIIYNKISSRGV